MSLNKVILYIILFLDNITWLCDSDSDMSVFYDNYHILSQNPIPSIFRIGEKKKREIQD